MSDSYLWTQTSDELVEHVRKQCDAFAAHEVPRTAPRRRKRKVSQDGMPDAATMFARDDIILGREDQCWACHVPARTETHHLFAQELAGGWGPLVKLCVGCHDFLDRGGLAKVEGIEFLLREAQVGDSASRGTNLLFLIAGRLLAEVIWRQGNVVKA